MSPRSGGRSVAVLLVVLLVGTAGCSSLSGVDDGGREGSPTGSVTPSPATGPDQQSDSATPATESEQRPDSDETRLRADVVGLTAEGVGAEAEQTRATVADRLDVEPIAVRVRPDVGNGTVEVFAATVTAGEFRRALNETGYQPETVRTGVTDATRGELVAAVRERLRSSGFDGSTQVSATGDRLTVTVTERNASAVRNVLHDRGTVRVYAVARNDTTGEWTHRRLLTGDDIAAVGDVRTPPGGSPQVPVTIEAAAAERFQSELVAAGFDDGAACGVDAADHDTVETINETCLVTTLDGEPVFVGGVGPGLGQSFADGSFANDPQFVMTTESTSAADALALALRSGRLPAPLAFEGE